MRTKVRTERGIKVILEKFYFVVNINLEGFYFRVPSGRIGLPFTAVLY